ncbi:MAG: DUF4143 domain-containing protein [Eubacteriales bacterium]|nr:DUF4143 domain-containing protein [Eubacteriales bacterium]
MAQLDPSLVLNGETPGLIDEWQEVPAIWDAVRYQADQSIHKGQFILTGSATPQTKGILHSGTGRIDRITMRPMSLFESGDSSGTVSLQGLFDGNLTPQETSSISLDKLIYLTVRGGWPGSLSAEMKGAIDIPKSYLHSVIENDLTRLDGIKRDTKKIRALLKSLARNTSTLANNQTLINDILEFKGEAIDPNTVSGYLDALGRLFLIENQPAFDPNYRSSTRVAKMPKRHFVDPSLAVAALEISPEMLINDLNLFGFLFESLVIRDLRIYAGANQGRVFHYKHHDTGKEIDAVVELADGRWGAFEIKLGANQIDRAAENLISIQSTMLKSDESRSPQVLSVICGLTNYAYRRDDGVFVVPITALGV